MSKNITVTYEPSSDEFKVEAIHWACGKADCTCDQETDELLDADMRETELEDCYE